MSEWFPVNSRIPDESSDAWCVGITGTGKCVAFIEKNAYENNKGGVNVPTYMMHGSEITHWMRLPKVNCKEYYVKRGHWVHDQPGWHKCSECGVSYSHSIYLELTVEDDKAPRHCTFCGAELWMKGEESDESENDS